MTPVAICARAPDGAITIATMIPTMHIRAIAHLQNEEPRRSSRLLPLRVPVTMQTPALRGRFATHPTPRASLGCPDVSGRPQMVRKAGRGLRPARARSTPGRGEGGAVFGPECVGMPRRQDRARTSMCEWQLAAPNMFEGRD